MCMPGIVQAWWGFSWFIYGCVMTPMQRGMRWPRDTRCCLGIGIFLCWENKVGKSFYKKSKQRGEDPHKCAKRGIPLCFKCPSFTHEILYQSLQVYGVFSLTFSWCAQYITICYFWNFTVMVFYVSHHLQSNFVLILFRIKGGKCSVLICTND